MMGTFKCRKDSMNPMLPKAVCSSVVVLGSAGKQQFDVNSSQANGKQLWITNQSSAENSNLISTQMAGRSSDCWIESNNNVSKNFNLNYLRTFTIRNWMRLSTTCLLPNLLAASKPLPDRIWMPHGSGTNQSWKPEFFGDVLKSIDFNKLFYSNQSVQQKKSVVLKRAELLLTTHHEFLWTGAERWQVNDFENY